MRIPYFFDNNGLEVLTDLVPIDHLPNNNISTTIKSNKDINLISGGEILTEGSKLSADGNIMASSEGNMNFESLAIYKNDSNNGYRTEKIINDVSELTAGGILKLVTNGSILFEATKLTAKGLGAVWKDPIQLSDWSNSLISIENQIKEAEQKIYIKQQNRAPLQNKSDELNVQIKHFEGAVENHRKFLSSMPIPADVISKSLATMVPFKKLNKYKEELAPITNELNQIDNEINSLNNTLTAAKNQLTKNIQELKNKGIDETKQQADIDAHNHAEAMRIGTIDVAAKGGYLYAKAQGNSEKREITRKSSSGGFFGSAKTTTEISQKTGHDVSEFIAAGNITMLSHDDSTYEASKIEAGKNIRLISTHGSVNFNAMPNTSFEQITSNSKGFFIKQSNSGHNNTTWLLPSISAGSLFTVDANSGINADIKIQKSQSLKTALNMLGENPETAWLKDLNNRHDVKWNEVQDAYENWDYSNQQLSPVASAVIAVAIAVVTAGSGLAVAAGASAASTATGVGAATAATATTTGAVVSGATIAGMSSLASKAAVTLINNQGNLSKTFRELGNSDTVKSTITSMAIGGALSGFDQAMGWTAAKDGANAAASSTNSNVPLLSKGDWIKTAQRVAGQSVISSSLNTAINDGSFKDNFATALLSNVGNQINAEGANLIGNNGAVLGVPGKAISHAAVSALAAEIGGGDAKGAAAGALAAELAAIVMESTLFESTYKNEPERQIHKLQEALTGSETKTQTAKMIGALSGALISGTPEGVYSAANSAELVYRYNYTEHMLDQIARENGRDMAAAAKGDQAAAERVAARQDAAIAVTAIAAGGYALTAGRYILIAASAEARLALQACKTDPILCVNQAGIFAADVVGPEAAMGTLAAGGTVKVLSNSTENAKDLAKELSHTSTALLKNEKPNTHAVTSLVEKEALYTGKRAQENYRVYDLNEVTDRALDLNKIRLDTSHLLKKRYQGDTPVSYAAASVIADGKTEYYLSVSGKAWSGNSPTTVNISGVNYKVILSDSESIPSIGNIETKMTNFNHAEQKLFSHIQDAYKDQKANINISVQNTSRTEQGMCMSCGYTSQNFAEMNKNFNVNIFQGSTGVNP
ncbi:conserved hypothetical protein [Xenorhabdus bovienii str. kraussei Quebec]|uniref:DUF637 domain-containing protein n=1 Tax=Xenorhabdus bovienii str. kraussei Quebec TaxID=1398203 RepID=A0A077PGA2_XENBV|nr:DUF637 domain-containing protein [Xenorhabdus bovienii]CDH20128.1 conserved hypothetical protein [Xenorhabdus bovienii str. kraussei Quebec]